ncbi:sulfur reduction protein DsrE [Isoptericola halotolerans]|uniref:sulfur reduction protein DsrE n=1 Tax=Isoptericola halotolerans TaxID=300560 RepID=UPI00388F6DF2
MTHQAAIVILTDFAADSAAVYRALGTAQEFVQAGDDVKIVFDGSGVDSLAAIAAPEHQLHDLLESLRDQVAGACGFCAKAHEAATAITEAGYPLLTDNKGHASLRDLVVEGRTVLTF